LENPALAQAASLGLTNPATWVWEKIPWSFVVDWLLPIGAYLDSMDATLGWTFRAGSTTKRVSGSVSQYVTPIIDKGTYSEQAASAAGSYGYKSLGRTVLLTFPFPSKIMNLIKNPLSTGHLANALALAAARYF
jgi:hypothetical protein